MTSAQYFLTLFTLGSSVYIKKNIDRQKEETVRILHEQGEGYLLISAYFTEDHKKAI